MNEEDAARAAEKAELEMLRKKVPQLEAKLDELSRLVQQRSEQIRGQSRHLADQLNLNNRLLAIIENMAKIRMLPK